MPTAVGFLFVSACSQTKLPPATHKARIANKQPPQARALARGAGPHEANFYDMTKKTAYAKKSPYSGRGGLALPSFGGKPPPPLRKAPMATPLWMAVTSAIGGAACLVAASPKRARAAETEDEGVVPPPPPEPIVVDDEGDDEATGSKKRRKGGQRCGTIGRSIMRDMTSDRCA